MRRVPIAGRVHSHWSAFMAGQTPQYPITIPPSDDTYDQLEFLSTCALATTQLSKENLLAHIAYFWTHSLDLDVFDVSLGRYIIKFPSQALRKDSLNRSCMVVSNTPVSFTPWSINSCSVYTLQDEDFWICLEGIPHHLWSVNLFHRMLAEFAELLKVDFGNDQAQFQGFAKVRIRLHLGKDLSDLHYFSFA